MKSVIRWSGVTTRDCGLVNTVDAPSAHRLLQTRDVTRDVTPDVTHWLRSDVFCYQVVKVHL